MSWTDRPYVSPRKLNPEDLPQKYTPQKASIGLNQLGQEFWPAFQSIPAHGGKLRQGFEAQKAAENERGHHRALEPPKGARHDPRHAYAAAVQHREAVDGYEQRAARGAARVRHSQIFRPSSDNPLVPGQGLTNNDALSESVKGAGSARSRGHDTASSFSLSGNPRFAGRHAFQAKNDNIESTPRRSRAAVPSHQLTETERRIEQDVVTQYPHGLPAGLLRAAKRMGLQTGPLAHGHTNSAPARTIYTLTHTN